MQVSTAMNYPINHDRKNWLLAGNTIELADNHFLQGKNRIIFEAD